ncbi:MAG: hydrogenase expression/formation protein HypE [Acidobacteriota bacterium]
MKEAKPSSSQCPLPLNEYPSIQMGHGGGGRLMHQLISKVLRPALSDPSLDRLHDGAELSAGGARLAFTTDSFVVQPRFFPGGDIGRLAVFGTVNDLAMCGARPCWLSAGLILEEGLSMEELWRIVHSMEQAASEASVSFVTGDTKVVDRGKGDGIFINTAGIGLIEHDQRIEPSSIGDGDVCIVSGDIGRHGIAIMNARASLELESQIESDLASLAAPVLDLLKADVKIHCMRDLTRGGLGSALIELAEAAGVHIHIRESALPVREDVRAACEILGLDPVYVANEGCFVLFAPPQDVDRALEILGAWPATGGPVVLGEVDLRTSGVVTIESRLGIDRRLDMLSGDQLPRIC